MRWKPKEHAFKKKYSSIKNSKKVMLHHLKKEGNLLMMLMFDLLLSKVLECICKIMLGYERRYVQLMPSETTII
jgi:hypothetical protein